MKQGWIQVTNNNTQETLAPKTMADMVYMDEAQSQSVKEAIQYHAPTHMTADIPANGWTDAAPYTQTVPVAGLLETDIPLVDVLLSSAENSATAELVAYSCISRIDTASNAITVTCYRYKPVTNMTLQMKVVR